MLRWRLQTDMDKHHYFLRWRRRQTDERLLLKSRPYICISERHKQIQLQLQYYISMIYIRYMNIFSFSIVFFYIFFALAFLQ